jgi:glycosyltransferase involved in cell wall biosynthesis
MEVIIAIPAYNEEKILKDNVTKLLAFAQEKLADRFLIMIADNCSNDQTAAVAQSLAQSQSEVRYPYVGEKGKGAAIRAAWESQTADIYCFMDADLATDLAALPALIEAVKSGADLAIGSRYLKGSKVKRSLFRKFFSFGYHLALVAILKTKIKDMPCGFKAINSKIKEAVLPQVRNNQWFFDSELVILAEKQGFTIKEIPVTWHDPREGGDKSRVNALSVGRAYLQEVVKISRRLKNKDQ